MTMEAATLPKKRNAIHKGKLKKTIKNVLCRPDPVFWPTLPEEYEMTLQTALLAYKINIPQFQKLHWNELKLIPKEKRPKPPKIKKVNGLLFGISECLKYIEDNDCSAIIVESNVNPQIIMQPVLEACISAKIPVVCLNTLKIITATHFGIPTCCLGIKKDCLLELTDTILELTKHTALPKDPTSIINKVNDKEEIIKDIKRVKITQNEQKTVQFPYLYRDSKKTRVFIPSVEETSNNNIKTFGNQSLIKLFQNQKTSHGHYIHMTLKRISSNLNRKRKVDSNND